ncbi:transcriptional regulator, ArsR family [Bradyrhizobium lablabi]|uniref:Transcriptional regulator, ArsR family n=1 Tax=Bradyrhizobium lablabi TaxID=722472 RepID=A0A1M6K1Y3_9BRAD|nr:metalloregulator ArsR/SmtB family transcription factor [Bradyrhizobium lablabi]SHJ52961.1 transcriptional regulator, ArsR family [Bradyrhizobium lablabi]
MINLDHTFAALADPKRRAIVARLVRGDATVGELAEPFGLSLLALSRHLKVLEDASLVIKEQHGKHRRCRLRREALTSAAEWIDFHRTFWNSNFTQTDVRLNRTKRKKKNREGGERPDPPSLMGMGPEKV